MKIVKIILVLVVAVFSALLVYFLVPILFLPMIANFIPQNRSFNCVYLNEKDCLKRSDCFLSIIPGTPVGKICIVKH